MSESIEIPGKSRIVDWQVRAGTAPKTLYVDVNEIEACVEVWRSGVCAGLGITELENPGLENLDCLALFDDVSSLHIRLDRAVDTTPVGKYADTLETFMSNDGMNGLREPHKFKRLKSLSQAWFRGIDSGFSLPELEEMALTGYRPAAKDLRDLPGAPRLSSLSLERSNATSLKGIARYSKLKDLRLWSLPSLVDASDLQCCESLEILTIENCRRLTGLDQDIAHIPLQKLVCAATGALNSLQFISDNSRLESFVLLDSDVIDGDMTPLVQHPSLKHIAFTKKKNFTHSERDVIGLRNAGSAAGKR